MKFINICFQISPNFLSYYFFLQFTILKRSIRDFGLHPAAGFFLGIAAFYGLSQLLFARLPWPQWFYLFAYVALVSLSGKKARVEFLQICAGKKMAFLLRVLENFLVAVPFLLFLLWQREYLAFAVLPPLVLLTALIRTESAGFRTIPTPFGRFPFEYASGFRRTWYILLALLFVCIMGGIYRNYNLAMFSLVMVFFVQMNFLAETENIYFIWIHQGNARTFLLKKMIQVFPYSLIITFPFILILLIVFPTAWGEYSLLSMYGMFCLLTLLLAKYSGLPFQLHLPHLLLYFLSVLFPPLLIFSFFYFMIISSRRLKEILV